MKIYLILILILIILNRLSYGGIFDPYTFTENNCNGQYQWTGWFDTNDPTINQGDFEITKHIQQIFSSFMCSAPIAIEGQTSNDLNPSRTGDVFRITVNDGFLCLNQQVNAYKNKICADYKVRYCCPINNG